MRERGLEPLKREGDIHGPHSLAFNLPLIGSLPYGWLEQAEQEGWEIAYPIDGEVTPLPLDNPPEPC